MIQTILINISDATVAIHSPERLDGYTFAYMIKFTVVSGRINNASLDRLSAILHMGKQTVSRCLKSALKYGYVHREGSDIVVNATRKDRLDYLYPLTKKLDRVSEHINEKDYVPECPFKFTKLKDVFRKIVAENHVAKQNDFSNTIECRVNPRSEKQYRRADRRINRMCRGKVVSDTDRLSNVRLANIMCCSKSKAKRLVKELVKDKVLSRKTNVEETDIDIQNELGIEYTKPNFKKIAQSWIYGYARNVKHGFPVLHWKCVDEKNYRLLVNIQYANSYSVVNDKIRLFL